MDHVDTLVVGAGVVGLAVARALALTGRDVLVVEAAETFGTQTSARNSEVIHAGIYYPRDSLKTRLCVRGRDQLYDYCAGRGIDARPVGKFIVATTEEQEPALDRLIRAAEGNGVLDLQTWTRDQVAEVEPEVRCVRALWSPSTGILDSHAYMLSLLGDIEAASGAVAFHAPFLSAVPTPEGFVATIGGEQSVELGCRELINAAGLSAADVANRIDSAAGPPHVRFARGCYFKLTSRAPFSRLIYPLPEPGGLGVHATVDLAGQVRFGPDVEWIDALDYTVAPSRADGFYAEVRKYWPDLPDGALAPDYAGIRPKISGPGDPAADFWIQADPNMNGLVSLFGIESPGLTASLAIGEHVTALLDAQSPT